MQLTEKKCLRRNTKKILDILMGIQVDVRSERFRQGRLYERDDGFAEALKRTAEKRLIRREQEGDKYWESEVERLKRELQD